MLVVTQSGCVNWIAYTYKPRYFGVRLSVYIPVIAAYIALCLLKGNYQGSMERGNILERGH